MERQPWFRMSSSRSRTPNRRDARYFRRARLMVEQLEDRNAAGALGLGDALAESLGGHLLLPLLQEGQPESAVTQAIISTGSASSDKGTETQDHRSTIRLLYLIGDLQVDDQYFEGSRPLAVMAET